MQNFRNDNLKIGYEESEAVRRLMHLMSDRDYKHAPPDHSDGTEDVFINGFHLAQGLTDKQHSQRVEADAHKNEYPPNHGIRRAELMRREVETALNSVRQYKKEMRSDGEDSSLLSKNKAEIFSQDKNTDFENCMEEKREGSYFCSKRHKCDVFT
jgi:hypothetical protein